VVRRFDASFLGSLPRSLVKSGSVIAYLIISIELELMFWLIPSFLVSAITVTFLGFFLCPIFPTTVITSKLLTKRIHVGAIGFVTAFEGTGEAMFPLVVEAIAQAKGVQVLPSITLGIDICSLGVLVSATKYPKIRYG
jgi:hypothetical protein